MWEASPTPISRSHTTRCVVRAYSRSETAPTKSFCAKRLQTTTAWMTVQTSGRDGPSSAKSAKSAVLFLRHRRGSSRVEQRLHRTRLDPLAHRLSKIGRGGASNQLRDNRFRGVSNSSVETIRTVTSSPTFKGQGVGHSTCRAPASGSEIPPTVRLVSSSCRQVQVRMAVSTPLVAAVHTRSPFTNTSKAIITPTIAAPLGA
jgi:hypothetical protein